MSAEEAEPPAVAGRQRAIRITVAAGSVAVLVAIVALAFFKGPASPAPVTAGAGGAATSTAGTTLPVLYEFTTDT